MSSNEAVSISLLLFPFVAAIAQAPASPLLSCPASIRVTETVEAQKGWRGTKRVVERSFERVSIYNGTDGGQEYELAPDEESEQRKRITQKWNLAGYRTMNLFLRCRYSGTSLVVSTDIPPGIAVCTFSFELAARTNAVVRSAFACR